MQKISLEWANEQHDTILVTYHTNDWEWSDFSDAFDEQRKLIDQSEAPMVHVIVDVINSQLMPRGGNLLSASRNLSRDVHPRQGHTVIVGAKGIVAAMADVGQRMMGHARVKFHTVPDMDSAHKMLEQIKASIA